jgi:hypothetical protein
MTKLSWWCALCLIDAESRSLWTGLGERRASTRVVVDVDVGGDSLMRALSDSVPKAFSVSCLGRVHALLSNLSPCEHEDVDRTGKWAGPRPDRGKELRFELIRGGTASRVGVVDL